MLNTSADEALTASTREAAVRCLQAPGRLQPRPHHSGARATGPSGLQAGNGGPRGDCARTIAGRNTREGGGAPNTVAAAGLGAGSATAAAKAGEALREKRHGA